MFKVCVRGLRPACLLFGEEPQRVHVAGSKYAKMSVVKGGQLRLIEPFDDCKHGSIHEPHVGIIVTVTDLADTAVVLRVQLLDAIGASEDVVQEGRQHARMQADMNPIVHFNQDGRWDDQALFCFFKKAPTGAMMGVAPVKGSIQRTRIYH